MPECPGHCLPGLTIFLVFRHAILFNFTIRGERGRMGEWIEELRRKSSKRGVLEEVARA